MGKICKGCNEEKHFVNFSKYPPKEKDGYNQFCKPCFFEDKKIRDLKGNSKIPTNPECDYYLKEDYKYVYYASEKNKSTFLTARIPTGDIVIDPRVLTNTQCQILINNGFGFLFTPTPRTKEKIRIGKDKKIITN